MMYADVANGRFDMTYAAMLDAWRENPISTDPDDVCWVSEDGTEYTCSDLIEATGVENQCEEA